MNLMDCENTVGARFQCTFS